MNRTKTTLFSCLIVTALAVLVLRTGVAGATPTFTCGVWSIASSQNVGSGNDVLNGVASVAASNTWAVGYSPNSQGNNQTLIEHWNGTSWSVVSSPNSSSQHNILEGVAALSANNIWAVGIRNGPSLQTLIEHWNGTSWSVISSPNAGGSSALNALYGVAVVSANNVWAVGDYANSGANPYQTLIEHWNGSSWSIVSSPSPGSAGNGLIGVAKVPGTNQVWAIGNYTNIPGSSQTLIEQWNGTNWKVVSSPNVGSGNNGLNGVAVVSVSNVWAVGNDRTMNGISQTLTEHWNGTSWSIISSPNVGSGDNSLNGVTVVSAKNTWAVGNYYNNNINTHQTLIEHWNGISWSVVSSPNAGTSYNYLTAVAHEPGTSSHIWAVGDYSTVSGSQTLTEFYC